MKKEVHDDTRKSSSHLTSAAPPLDRSIFFPVATTLKGGLSKMRRFHAKPLSLCLPALVLAGLSFAPAPASGANCIQIFVQCLVDASDIDTWWGRTSAGIDCYLDAVDCLRAAYG